MTTSSLLRSIQKNVAHYQLRLDEIDEAHFVHSPPIGGWSISEVYAHIFDSSLLSLMAIARIIKGDGELQPTHWAVRLILFFGSLPPGKKYEAPARLKERVKKINKMAAQQLLTDFELQLAKIYPLLEKPVSGLKVKHPRLGYLDAKQWFRFIEIHLKHHLKQIKRIDKSFEQ